MNRSTKTLLMLTAIATLGVSGFAGVAQAGVETRCKACHSFEKDVPGRIGPSLYGVIGRKAGTTAGFQYSPALKNSGITWTEENIRKWIDDSRQMVPGVRMPPQQIKGQKADEVIAFLKSIS